MISGLAATLYILFAPYFQDAEPPPTSLVKVGDEVLKFKGAYLRADARRDDPAVELAAFFPDFEPAGRFDDVTARTSLDARFDRVAFLSIKPADGLDPAERTARLYERFLDENSWSEPGGLTARAFAKGSPFEGDELHYIPPEGRQFSARCRRPDAARKIPNVCVTSFRSGGLDVDVRFSSVLLGDWQRLLDGARGLLEAARH
jgi:hypothetical protein